MTYESNRNSGGRIECYLVLKIYKSLYLVYIAIKQVTILFLIIISISLNKNIFTNRSI